MRQNLPKLMRLVTAILIAGANMPGQAAGMFTMPGEAPKKTLAAPTTRPQTYSGPHNYSLTRGTSYGYESHRNGQIEFFRYDGMRNGVHTLVSFFDNTSSMITCSGNCEFVRVVGYGFDRTYKVNKTSVLGAVVEDMLRGALQPTH
ncbi:hypothetical protein PSP31121_04022 [Pandoraea sputorum]|uniref:Uncharacterized protein n=1 Tax=Pandoraea sputorum TaxID=93222 RepID=A0A5E5BC03_9BURK|nr:hypothetical protein PSP31121_04022 [Pandoraea sputorum]